MSRWSRYASTMVRCRLLKHHADRSLMPPLIQPGYLGESYPLVSLKVILAACRRSSLIPRKNEHVGRNTATAYCALRVLRTIGVIDRIVEGDISTALSAASRRWAALPQGPGEAGRYPQPYMEYEDFESSYKSHGGTLK